MLDIRCVLGSHKWQSRRVAEWKFETITLFMDSDVCARCGEYRVSLNNLTAGLPPTGVQPSVDFKPLPVSPCFQRWVEGL